MTTANGGRRPAVLAHRGASSARPENTLEAFRYAGELGADGVELDVRATRDGVLVVHHDARLPDGRVLIDLDRAHVPESVPTLDAALDVCTDLLVNVEIKNDPGDPDHDPTGGRGAVIADHLVGRQAQGDRILVSSFDHGLLGLVRRRHPDLDTAALVAHSRHPARLVERVAEAGHAAINPIDHLVDAELVELAHGLGLAVHVWTVDDPIRMAELAGLGVDGIITNAPDLARAVVDALA
jgi:glycerophosphoryl diester phosphodiesterase